MKQNPSYVVGKRYRVPCVKLTEYWSAYFCEGDYLPVIGPPHEDREIIGFPARHWHIDFRFISPETWEDWGSGYAGHSRVHGRVISFEKTAGFTVLRRIKCHRPMPTFPTELVTLHADGGAASVPWLKELEAAYSGHRVKPGCATCPHRGIPLDGLPTRNGVVVCPGHGLAWDLNTGKLAPRVTEGASA